MNRKDALELKRRFTKECSITRLAGCYVDCNKKKVVSFSENFLNLAEEEFYKYLEIAKKTISGTIGNNILELQFPSEEEEPGGKQQFFRGLCESRLENPDILDRFYDLIIENYRCTGNYLILVFKDTYDVITKTKDNMELDESEEVFDYFLVSICPVDLSKPGLGYNAQDNRIGARIRDWVVAAPDIGFLFPAFNERSSDVHRCDYFLRDTKDNHEEFIDNVLGCSSRRTATMQRQAFNAIVRRALSSEQEDADDAIMNIQESMNAVLEERIADSQEPDEDGKLHKFMKDSLSEPIVLEESLINEILDDSGIDESPACEIKKYFKEEFADELPTVENLVDERAIRKNAPKKLEKELTKEIIELTGRLRENGISRDGSTDPEAPDVVLRVKPKKAEQIHSQIIDDRKYLLIPVEEDDRITINGRELD